MTQEQLIARAFIEACKYISKKNFELDKNIDMEEISIKAFYGGSNDEWKYWADYFIEKAKE